MTARSMTAEATDAELAARMMDRDETALREVIRRYGGIVNGMARRVLADATLAEEVAQDAFVAIWRRPGSFDPERGSLKAFLTSVARNKAIDLVRREESLKRTKQSLVEEMGTAPASSSFEEEVHGRSTIVTAMQQLPQPQREAIALAYFGGRTYRDVAVELDIPEGTAKTRMRDGLTKLRSLLGSMEKAEDE
jgi:RNA polymerase sigma-70 factor (ECF subfamily)